MQQKFEKYLQEQFRLQPEDTILLGLSGGVDSTVLAILFKKAGYQIALAHCNFKLRDRESDEDAVFCENFARTHNLKYHFNAFDTERYAKDKGVSIQMAARELRFQYFDDLLREYGYAYIATAHHLDDQIETFFINLMRGSGLSGLRSIQAQSGKLIHPLLFASREEVEHFARENRILYRTDSSNASDKYLRNNIRHNLIPAFEKFSADFRNYMSDNFTRLSRSESLLKDFIGIFEKEFLYKDDEISIPFSIFEGFLEKASLLFEVLKDKGFTYNQCNDMILCLSTGQSGKRFFSALYEIFSDRDRFVLRKHSPGSSEEFLVEKDQNAADLPVVIEWDIIEHEAGMVFPSTNYTVFLDYQKLVFPIRFRKWKLGDWFIPLGMKGRKKLSDYFIDNKFSLADKEKCWVMESDGKIAWIIGHRIDERFKVGEGARKIIRLHYKH